LYFLISLLEDSYITV